MKKIFLMALSLMFVWAVGNAKVNGSDNEAETPDGVEAVDLGLSVKWANMNVGASKESGFGITIPGEPIHGAIKIPPSC